MALPEETFATDTKSGSPLKTSSTTGKRKRTATSQKKAAVDDLGDETSVDVKNPSPSKVQKRSPKKPKDEEKRLRRHRSYAPSSYLEKLQRATTQRMFVIDRARDDQALEETVIMAGSTGNIYSLIIGLVPSCTCPDNQKGNQCKHIIYVWVECIHLHTAEYDRTDCLILRYSTTFSKRLPTFNTNSPSSQVNSEPSLITLLFTQLHPLPPQKQNLPTASQLKAIAPSASSLSSQMTRRLCSAALLAGIISTLNALSSGQNLRLGRRLGVFTAGRLGRVTRSK